MLEVGAEMEHIAIAGGEAGRVLAAGDTGKHDAELLAELLAQAVLRRDELG